MLLEGPSVLRPPTQSYQVPSAIVVVGRLVEWTFLNSHNSLFRNVSMYLPNEL